MKEEWKEEDEERERTRLETPQVEKSEENSGSREEFWSVLEIRDAVDFEESESSSYARRAWRSSGNRNLIVTL